MTVQVQRRRFTVEEYHRVELIQGEVVEMAAIGSRDAACVNRLIRLLRGPR